MTLPARVTSCPPCLPLMFDGLLEVVSGENSKEQQMELVAIGRARYLGPACRQVRRKSMVTRVTPNSSSTAKTARSVIAAVR